MSTHNEIKYTNRLINETSLYLLQHAHNPVDWYPWGDEAFGKAKKENKLVLISIGYAACHWCHVMEEECFENEAIANMMNENYICIKVDREERPDVDQIYMSAVQMITGSGGWPLNCFVLPDKRPVYGGTYFRPSDWKNVLVGLNATFKDEPDKINKAAEDIAKGIHEMNVIPKQETLLEIFIDPLSEAVEDWKQNFDLEWGGNNRAPKFPMPVGLAFLNNFEFYTEDKYLNDHLNNTLNRMAHGGIYDLVGGGFARYSVDKYWKVPHFEKMLYDNAQLVSIYAKAYQQTNSLLYKQVVEQVLGFVELEMKSGENAYYSSFDADSEGVEGKFYVWSEKELKEVLDPDELWVIDYYNVEEKGNWEGNNILWITAHNSAFMELNISEVKFYEKLKIINEKLYKVRSKRIHPGLDNKILTEWNALMGIAFLDAFAALGNQNYLNSALELGSFFSENIIKESGIVYRNFTNGNANINGVLNDYALLISFYIRLYQVSMNASHLATVDLLLNYTLEHFRDKESGMFFYTGIEATDLISRSIEISDNVIPSSNAVMAHNLLDLSVLLGNSTYREMSYQMLVNVKANVEQNLAYFAHWASLWLRFTQDQYEVVVCGENSSELLKELRAYYHPNVLLLGTNVPNEKSALFKKRWVEGETLIYVCKGNTCQLPVKTVADALELIKYIANK